MLTRRHIISALLSLTFFHASASAQNAQQPQAPAPAVTAAATDAGARFTAPGEVLQLRLEVYSASGERVFDSGPRAGAVIDWKADAVADGQYVSVVTVKGLDGRSSRRLGAVAVQSGKVSLSKLQPSQLTAEQSQALKADASADDSVAIYKDGKERAATVTTHDGAAGQLTSTSGDLTLNTGDVFTGKEQERVRVTADGRVGVGTSSPEEALDVAGTIRAQGGIRFADGTVLTSAAQLKSPAAVLSAAVVAGDGTMQTMASGVGTSGRLSKWIDGAGTLGDSSVSDVNGNVGIGTASPTQKFEMVGNSKYVAPAGSWVMGTAHHVFISDDGSPVGFQNTRADAGSGAQMFDHTGAMRAFFQWHNVNAPNANTLNFATVQNDGITFTTNTYDARMTITGPGNVGIGTKTPSQKLEVVGSLKLAGAGSGIVFPDGTVQTTAGGSGGGGSMSGTSIISAINTAGTVGTINSDRLAANVARTNGANSWTGANVFGAGLSANNALITNVGNPVNAGDATNKAYTDANFVKFVPGAEQLSVGDANGTAPMINLRGGSTCCSGPGGHTPAWFKVFQNGSFVATGNLGIGVSPMQGKGYRTSWDSYKGAFRSGYADNEWDDANVGFFSWAGGSNSTAIGLYALAFGDTNSAESTSSIVFGSGNQVKGAAGFSAGAGNRVCDTYGVALGNNAKSGGPLINGKCDPDTFNIRGLAAVAIGYNVTADQDHTTAMGKFASNNGFTGTFIWSDGSAQQTADTFRNTANNEFAARATGGFRFRTNLGGTTGCNLPAGSGVFNCTSSRTTKENFTNVDGNDVLARLRKVPVSTWNYIAEGQQSRHLGPMAEDFYTAFQLGTTDKAIGIQDAVGVSLAAVKALDARTLELQQKSEEVEQLRNKVNTLEQRLAALEQLMHKQADNQQK
ncbi:MAG TPA: tail fiber domain-containing protein [Pyrinomonadaceae bacterium]|nr:tail fiber domain-containing protein [Pyrinomonadaceae bacterium]